jgi:hypothetical protein
MPVSLEAPLRVHGRERLWPHVRRLPRSVLPSIHSTFPLIPRADSVAGRIRTLFLIALGNFVFPVLFNVALILILTVGRERIDIVYVVPANVYVTIFGVVFATGAPSLPSALVRVADPWRVAVWNSAHAVAEQGRTRASAPDENALPPLAFKHSYPSGTEMTRTVDRHVAGRKESDASFLDITVHRSQIMQRI